MTLREFLGSLTTAERRRFCELAGTSSPYVYQVATGHRRVGPESAKRWARASEALFADDAKHLKLADLRPDIWGEQPG